MGRSNEWETVKATCRTSQVPESSLHPPCCFVPQYLERATVLLKPNSQRSPINVADVHAKWPSFIRDLGRFCVDGGGRPNTSGSRPSAIRMTSRTTFHANFPNSFLRSQYFCGLARTSLTVGLRGTPGRHLDYEWNSGAQDPDSLTIVADLMNGKTRSHRDAP